MGAIDDTIDIRSEKGVMITQEVRSFSDGCGDFELKLN
jgi:hypothetical protein